MNTLIEEKPKYAITRQDYQNLLASTSGQKVLAHFLMEYHFFEEIETPEEIVERNMLIRFLRNAGVLKQENVLLLAQKLINISRSS